jgi:two-component system, OmpR family, response regulator
MDGIEADNGVRFPLRSCSGSVMRLTRSVDCVSAPTALGQRRVQASPRVLVVDDDGPICEVIELALVDDGWDIRTRTSAQEALDLLVHWSADLIVLDLCMPGMDAEAFLTAYRETSGRQAPVLLTSAASGLEHHAVRLGVSGMLVKPFDVDDLCALVRHILGRDGVVTRGSGAPAHG